MFVHSAMKMPEYQHRQVGQAMPALFHKATCMMAMAEASEACMHCHAHQHKCGCIHLLTLLGCKHTDHANQGCNLLPRQPNGLRAVSLQPPLWGGKHSITIALGIVGEGKQEVAQKPWILIRSFLARLLPVRKTDTFLR